MKLLPNWSICFLFIICFIPAFGQETSSDSTTTPTSLETEEINVVDLVFQKSLMSGINGFNEEDQGTYIKNSSGTWFLGLGFKIPILKNRAGFRLTPGFAWIKLNYDSVNTVKTFPDVLYGGDIDYNYLEHRLSYFQVPLGAYVNFTVDEKGRALIFGEVGGYVGYRIGGVLRYDENTTNNNRYEQQIRGKIMDIPDTKDLQYGLYGRVGYRNIALHVQYRLEDLFTEYKTENISGQPSQIDPPILNPVFPQLEIGLTLLL